MWDFGDTRKLRGPGLLFKKEVLSLQESKWDWGLQRWVTGRGDTKSGLVVTRLVDPQVDGAISLHHDKIKITLNV